MEKYNQRNIEYKLLIKDIAFALAAGGVGAILGGKMNEFNTINKPAWTPPPIAFPIVWTSLYILMGASSYLICVNKTDPKFKKKAFFAYLIQLILNVLWTPIFFRFKNYYLAFIWILLLIVSVIIMMIKFYKIKPLAAIIQIPYIIWLVVAAILNYNILILN